MTDTTGDTPGRRSFNGGSMLIGLLSTAIFDVVLAIVIFQLAVHRFGASNFTGYLVASIGPLLGMVIALLRTRKIDGVAIIILINLLISAAVTLIGTHDAKALLLKDSLVTGAFGAAILISAIPIFPKPLMFFFGMKFATDGTREGTAWWYGLWDRYPTFRSGQRFVNNVWGVGFLTEAAVKAACVYLLPFGAAYAVNQIAPFVLLAGLITFSIRFGMRQRREGEERQRAAMAGAVPHES